MVEDIIHMLQQRRPNVTQDWLEKLPRMARLFENTFYHEADSLSEYADSTSIKHRLQQLALKGNGGQSGGASLVRLSPQYPQQKQQQQQASGDRSSANVGTSSVLAPAAAATQTVEGTSTYTAL